MPTFAEIATNDPESRFDILVNAASFVDAQLPGTNLVATLSDPDQSLTVFAPTDVAFGQLAIDQGFTGDTTDESAVTTFLTGLGAETLRDVILYHVSSGPQTAAQISAAGEVVTLLGPTITADLPTLVDAEPDLIDPSVTTADIAATNGVLHVIDRVLLPVDFDGNDAPTLAGLVAASGAGFDDNSGDFDLLLEAVTTADLVGALDDPAADLTVFAPTDAAFLGLAQTLGFQGTDEEGAWSYLVDALTLLGDGDPLPLLTQVLTYHVAGESLQASQVLASTGIATLQGGTLMLEGTSIVDADPDLPNPNLIQTDIQAANGIAHALDGVLLPVDVLVSDGSNDVDFVLADDQANQISTGLDADLVDGNGGADRIELGAGNDVGFGGSGSDRLFGGGGNDNLKGDSGNDILNGGSRTVLTNNDGADRFDGGEGIDSVSYSGSFGSLLVDLLFPEINTFAAAGDTYNSIENLVGSQGSDNLRGTLEANRIVGEANVDYIFGRQGNDDLVGGRGNDVLFGGVGRDRLDGGEHTDRAQYSESLTAIVADLADSTQNTGEALGDRYFSIEGLAGSSFGDDLRGDAGANELYGREGDDLLTGRDGNDYLNGGAGMDTLNGGTGDDTLRGGQSVDTFVFDGGADVIEDFDADMLMLDDALWNDQALTNQQILDFASATGGDTLFDFGNGNTLLLQNYTDIAALDSAISVF